MANVKISDLPAASSAAGTDQLETNQGGTSRRLTVAQVATHVRSTATDTVVVAAGSAAAPSIAPTGDSNTGIFFPAADTIAFAEGGAEALRLDASGNCGLGTSSPNKSGSNVALTVNAASGQYPAIELSTNNVGRWYVNADATNVYDTAMNGTNRTFYTGGSERMRIDASGNVGIGTSSPGVRFHVNSGAADEVARFEGTGSPFITLFDTNVRQFYLNAVANSVDMIVEPNKALVFGTNGIERARITAGGEFYIAGTVDQGAYNLQVNGTGVWGAGAYVNGSDARIKDDIAPLASGLDVVAKLKPVQFRYKESWSKDTSLQPGFIAQDLQTALADQPYVDGVVLQGPEYMSVAYQSLIPLLTKAIQELKAENDALKARVAALENK